MIKQVRALLCVALPLLMAGCYGFPGTTYELDELKSGTPTGPAFTQNLSKEYAAFADEQKSEYDWMAMWHFARKGLAAAHGTAVQPEVLSDWSFDDADAAAALAAARARLMTALASSAPTRFPALLATAQVKFDCWVEEQDEGWQKDEIANCRKGFETAMSTIDQQSAPAMAAPAAPAPMPAMPANYQVFFDFDKSVITPAGHQVVDEIIAAAKADNFPKMTIVGHTDTVGTVKYNLALSVRRANAVAKALIAGGVPADRVSVSGVGKTDLLVATGDGVREPRNRRAVAVFVH